MKEQAYRGREVVKKNLIEVEAYEKKDTPLNGLNTLDIESIMKNYD